MDILDITCVHLNLYSKLALKTVGIVNVLRSATFTIVSSIPIFRINLNERTIQYSTKIEMLDFLMGCDLGNIWTKAER
jgi:hypothetical protein